MKYVRHFTDMDIPSSEIESFRVAWNMGFRYVRVDKNGEIWRPSNPLFYNPVEVTGKKAEKEFTHYHSEDVK